MKKLETVKNEFITLVLAKGATSVKIERLASQLAKITIDENYWQLPEYKQRNALMEYEYYLDEKIGVLEWHPLHTKYEMSINDLCDLYNTYYFIGRGQ